MRRLAYLVALVALVACSSDDSDDRGLADAVQSYSDGYLTGDGQRTHGLLSARCQDRHALDGWSAVVELAGGMYGSPLDFGSYEAEVSGDMARVTYTYDAYPEIDQASEPWVFEDGGWRQDDC